MESGGNDWSCGTAGTVFERVQPDVARELRSEIGGNNQRS